MHAACPPSALQVATYAVTLLENDPLFNAGKGAVFTRDGIQQLEASVMVSRGHAKRAAGALGLRHVKNPSKRHQDMMMNFPRRSTSHVRVSAMACLDALHWVQALRQIIGSCWLASALSPLPHLVHHLDLDALMANHSAQYCWPG